MDDWVLPLQIFCDPHWYKSFYRLNLMLLCLSMTNHVSRKPKYHFALFVMFPYLFFQQMVGNRIKIYIIWFRKTKHQLFHYITILWLQVPNNRESLVAFSCLFQNWILLMYQNQLLLMYYDPHRVICFQV